MPAWLMEVHEEWELAQAWPGYHPELTTFQMLVGVHIHRLYEKKRAENEAQRMKGMFGG